MNARSIMSAHAGMRCSIRWMALLAVLFFLPLSADARQFQDPAGSEIIKSATDARSYRSLTLPNRMQVLLISDPETDQAAAAMDVAVGQLSDPPHRQGMAHFLEHMLFLGTDKYPDADAYGKYLAAHGGHSNAFTALEDTNYFFTIQKEYLEGALDRFSQFFISPRFNAEFAEREINAVNSEHQKNIKNDQRRIYQVIRNTANPTHPFSKFGTGNQESLRGGQKTGGNLREQLIRFYENHYSANLMRLVILGHQPLDELQRLAETYFAAVPDRGIERDRFAGQPVIERPLGRKITIRPVKSMRQLRLMFPIPSRQPYYRSKPAGILSHLLGDEGKGSILAYLKKEGLATSLSAGTGPDSRDFSFITVTIRLTPQGLQQTERIVTTVFQYITRMRAVESLERYFQEFSQIADVNFRYREKEEPANYVSHLAMNMQDVPVRHVLVSPWLYEEYRPQWVRSLLQRLTPENMQLVLIADGVPVSETDPWYGTAYGVTQIPQSQLSRWRSAGTHPELKLPPPNPFIVEAIVNHPLEARKPYPVLLKETDRLRLWYKPDDVFRVPKGNLRIRLSTPDAYATPRQAAMTKLFAQLLNERLNAYSYPALIAGLHYSLHNSVRGLELSLSGYSDNLGILFRKIIEAVNTHEIDAERFRILKDQMIEDRRNMKLSEAYRQVGYEMIYLLSKPFWHTDDYLAVISDLSVSDLQAFIPTLFSRLQIDFLAHGNFKESEVLRMADLLDARLPIRKSPLTPNEQTIRIPAGETWVYPFEVPDVNSAIQIYYQAGPSTIRQAVMLDVIQQIIEKPFYHRLRTIEQLGYLVWSGHQESDKVDGFMFIIQSSVKSPAGLQSRIESFVSGFESKLENLDDQAFSKYKEALIARRREAPKNLQEETGRYWETLSSGRYDFERRKKEIAVLQELKLPAVRTLYKKVFVNPASVRKLIVQGFGRSHPLEKPAGQEIQNPGTFKKEMRFYPNPEEPLPEPEKQHP